MAVSTIPNPNKGDVITYTVSKESVSISANSFADVSIPFSIPSGYTNIGIMRATFSSSWCVPFNVYISGSNVVVSIRNYSGGASSGTAYVIFLLKKN